jgi:hypothetical protein
MRALRLFGSLAIACLFSVGVSCGSDDDNKGDGGTGGSGAGTGGSGTGTGGSGAGTGGTGGASGGASMFACDYSNYAGTGYHWCWTWDASNVPSPGTLISAYQMSCTQSMGMSVTACPTSGAVGKCTFTSTSGGQTVSQTIFYYAPITTQIAQQACMTNNQGGVTATWTPL